MASSMSYLHFSETLPISPTVWESQGLSVTPPPQSEGGNLEHLSKVDQFILVNGKKILDELLEGELTEATRRRIMVLTYQIQVAEEGPPTAVASNPISQADSDPAADGSVR